jgi:hypothetical protein
MITRILCGLLLVTSLSCEDLDPIVLPVIGLYEAQILGINDEYDINISANGDDNILIEAPFDSDVWSVIEADLDEKESGEWDIDIFSQQLAPGISIKGDGFFYRGKVQLDYTINFHGDKYDYRMIAIQY